MGIGTPLVGRLLLFDALAMAFREIGFARDPACPACGDGPRQSVAVQEVAEITAAELRERLDAAGPGAADAVLLDVREPSERQAFHLGGRLIPLGELDGRVAELDGTDSELVVYCASGGRSGRAVQVLRERGVHAVSLRGGVAAWRALSA